LPFDNGAGVLLGYTRVSTSNAVFWRKELMDKIGFMNPILKCNMDGEYFSRLLQNAHVKHVPVVIANFRQQTFTKASQKFTNWQALVRDEINIELKNSWEVYKNSKQVFLPREILGSYYKIKRIILRLFKFHYILKFFEKSRYKYRILIK
jgi:hypothetical protein